MQYRTIRAASEQTADLRFSPTDELSGNKLLDAEDDILIQFVKDFNQWLESQVGVSLTDYTFKDFTVDFFAPADQPPADPDHLPTDPGGKNYNPLNPGEPGVLQTSQVNYFYSGSLLGLLTLALRDFYLYIPDHAHYRQENKSYYLIQLIHAGVRRFTKDISSLNKKGFLDESFGKWKLANHYIRNLSKRSNDSLTQVVTRLSANRIERHLAFLYNVAKSLGYTGIVSHQSDAKVVMRKRKGNEFDEVQSLLGNWTLPPLGGDASSRASVNQAVALAEKRRTFIGRLVRDGQEIKYDSDYRPAQITPDNDGPCDIAPLREIDDLQLRREEIRRVYLTNSNALVYAPASVRSLLREAFYLVPCFLGHRLQQGKYYEEALGYYRLVFDDRQAPGKRKIDYSLKLEEDLALDYDRAEEFLEDSSNSHAIAVTRKNTYTRHILLLIVRCLIDYADTLFSRDNVADNSRARELYTRALTLLELKVVKPGKSQCENIIGEMVVDVVEAGGVPVHQFQLALAEIGDVDRLRAVVDSLTVINQDTSRSAAERLGMMREVVATTLEETPGPKSQSAVRKSRQDVLHRLENQFVASPRTRVLLEKTQRRRRESKLVQMAELMDLAEEELREAPLPWLRQQSPETGQHEEEFALAFFNPDPPGRSTAVRELRSALPFTSVTATEFRGFTGSGGISFVFCLPQNPMIQALRKRAENNLTKLRTCRNIAGMVRQMDPYGAPMGLGSGLVSPDGTIFNGIVEEPTAFRYAALIARAKELVSLAQQIESGYQAALENAEREGLSLLQAEQSVEQAAARITLQDLRLNQANTELGLAQLQKANAVLREATYEEWIAAGKNQHEESLLQAYSDAAEAQRGVARANAFASVAQMHSQIVSGLTFGNILSGRAFMQAADLHAAIGWTVAAERFQEREIDAQARAQSAAFEASFERRNDEWQLQQGLAALDVQIGDQQIQLAQDGIAIVQQERVIAALEHTHAADILAYLLRKTFTEELYRWIASVLENVYRFFLQEATSIAHLAERQLAFERQQTPLKVIQPDYWNIPVDGSSTTLTEGNADRLGLTGSARLLKDIYQLDQYAFETRQRKQALTITLDLAEMYPVEFQRFRKTGVLLFETPLSLIDRQLPGHYLCLIQQVSVSVVALIPPTYGIRASLTSAGTSRAVVGGDTFQTVTIRNLPERIALTSATTATGVIELEPDAQSLLRPFEGTGFETLWELRMPKAANRFDFNTIATVLVTVNMTALHSFDYERQVIEAMDRRLSANRAFHFRQEFADPWYDLHNPGQTDTPMTVRFETRREDFPSNLRDLRIQHVSMYFVQEAPEAVSVSHLRFTSDGSEGAVGGGTRSVGSIISTRRGNGSSWLPMIGRPPFGVWELAFPDTAEVRNRFANEEFDDILLVLTVEGETPAWPA